MLTFLLPAADQCLALFKMNIVPLILEHLDFKDEQFARGGLKILDELVKYVRPIVIQPALTMYLIYFHR